jgi:hypothetical protein
LPRHDPAATSAIDGSVNVRGRCTASLSPGRNGLDENLGDEGAALDRSRRTVRSDTRCARRLNGRRRINAPAYRDRRQRMMEPFPAVPEPE